MLNYLFVFLTVVGINIVPVLMPPTWIVLVFFYSIFPTDIVLLALVGAIASTIGRFGLTYIGTFFRRFFSKKRQKSMDIIRKEVKQHPLKSFAVTFAYALSPLPSNVYFTTLGFAKARSAMVFLGFFFGRFVSYALLVASARFLIHRFERFGFAGIFESRFSQILLIDVIGIVFMILFIAIDWNTLITKKKLRFISFKLRK